MYPTPTETTIVEPFAGSATYALHYPALNVRLNDIDPVIFGVWDYLIRVSPKEIMALPIDYDDVSSLTIPQEAKWLIGFWLAKAATRPFTKRIGWAKDPVYARNYWGKERRQRVAEQVSQIKHWTVTNKPFESLPSWRATWFVDPPYCGKAGRAYTHNAVDFVKLSSWCRSRHGQVIVCESAGSTWLPFSTLGTFKTARDGKSEEVIWTSAVQ